MSTSDETLVSQAVKLGDMTAFAELMQRHQGRILLLQRRLCGEHSLAEDLSQETFLRAWQKLDTYQGSGSFGGWLAKLSYNVFLQFYRRQRRRKDEVPLDEIELSSSDPDNAALADLDRLLGLLDQEDQIIMTLNYAFGLTNIEVGDVLNMPSGTVKARIHRAKAKIRQHLDPASEPVAASSQTTQPDRTQPDRTPRPSSPAKTRIGFFGQLTGAQRL